jgi:hypothetical protein
MTDRHEHLDEGMIHAWLDGALAPDESVRVEVQVAHCSECAALVAEARGLVAASSRILSSLDAVPGGVIPGSTGSVDQLAALRARHGRRQRHWWNDRRFVAAASLVFVAGASTMVWRFAPESAKRPVAERSVDALQPLADSPSSVAAPAATAPSSERTFAQEAPARDARSEAASPATPPAPQPVAARAVDTTREQKAAATMPLSGLAANEARVSDMSARRTRQAEARRELSRADQVAPIQQSVQQQGGAAKQQGLQQLRPDTMRVSVPPPSFGARGRMAPALGASVAPGCFQIHPVPPVPDSVKLVDEMLPILSDPSMFRAEYIGRSRTTPIELYWIRVDSITIDLRARAADSIGVRFTTNGTVPSASRDLVIRSVTAQRIICP